MRSVLRVKMDGQVLEIERLERNLAVEHFEHGPNQKALCNGCPNFNRNLACPPFSPHFADYIAPARRARVICLRLPLKYFLAQAAEARPRAAFQAGSGWLSESLLKARAAGRTVAGAGECRACEVCAAAAEPGDPDCVRPERRIYSLESLGVHVAALVKRCFSIELEWTAAGRAAKTVSVVGAIFG